MRELLVSLIQSPSRDSYLALYDAIASSEAYDPYSDELTDVEEMIDEERFEEAQSLLMEAMPNLLASPGAHLLSAHIREKLGDAEGAKFERHIGAACAEGILATGNGTESQPYQILRTSDEYDVLAYLGKQPTKQSLVPGTSKHFDVIECADGAELWFDITTPFGRLTRDTENDNAHGPSADASAPKRWWEFWK